MTWLSYHPRQGQAVKHAIRADGRVPRAGMLVSICGVVLERVWVTDDEDAPRCTRCRGVLRDAAEALVDNIERAQRGDA